MADVVTLADRLAAPPVVRKGPPCTVAVIMARLDEADAQALADAMADERYGLSHIHDALRLEGHALSRETVRRHRRGECACTRYQA